MKDLSQFKKEFDLRINEYLDKKVRKAEKVDKKAKKLILIIKEFINNGGKRLRPAIFYFAYQSYKKKSLDKILFLSFVFEFFQTFALIHDDIIDNSDQRRSNLTIHKKYGIGTAILAGDLALMFADEIFFNFANKKKNIKKLYNQLKQQTMIGQYLDLIKIDDSKKIIDLKTVEYSFVKPAMIGFLLAGIKQEEINKWKTLLKKLGFIFQINNDLNGIDDNSDIQEGKITLIIKKFLQKANSKEIQRFRSFYGGKNISKENLVWFKRELIMKKVIEDIKTLIKNESNEIKKILNLRFAKHDLAKIIDQILIQINI